MADFSVTPYFDDFDEQAKFLKVLFRPGYAVQTRELNQAQSILQNQISRFGNHIFKDGAMIIPGNIGHDNTDYVKIQSTNSLGELSSTFLQRFENTIITGATTGVTALVLKTVVEDGVDPNTIYIKYLTSGTSNQSTFADGEILTNDAEYPLTISSALSASTGKGTLATIQDGIFYISGNFVLVSKQIIIVNKYATNASAKIGLRFVEEIITPEIDETLYDNAIGTPNQSAPGAHRLKITTSLESIAIDSEADVNFIELLRINENIVQVKVTKTEYSELEKTFARRTYDESGDYIVNGLAVQMKEHRNNNRGSWTASTTYLANDIITVSNKTYFAKNNGISGSSQPTFTDYANITDNTVTWLYTENPKFNFGVYVDGDETKVVAAITPGKAYVRGYELEKFNTTYVPINKSRNDAFANSTVINTTVGNYILVESPFSIIESFGTSFPKIDLYDSRISTPGTFAGTKIGEARVRWIEKDDVYANAYKLFIFNISLNSDKSIERHVKSVYYNNTTLSQDFTANIYPIVTQLSGSITTTATTITGTGTKFNSQLIAGDYIQYTFNGTTYVSKVDIITNDYTIGITGGPTVTASVPFNIVKSTIYEPKNATLLFPLPKKYIKNIRSADGVSYADTAYYVTKYFTRTQASGTTLALNVDNASTDTFAPTTAYNYLVIKDDGTYSSSHTLSLNAQSTTLTISNLTSNAFYTVLAAVRKAGVQEKTKTLTIATLDLTTSATANNTTIYLKPDVYRILAIKQAPAFGTIQAGNLATYDVSNNFVFNNGQRDTHYDRGTLKHSINAPKATGSIRIIYEYFTHSSSGEYFSVDSYKNIIPYTDIPVNVRDYLDFRPRISDDGTTFSGTNLSVPKRGYTAEADFSYYLAKKTNIELDIYGSFITTDSESSILPTEAPLSKNTMLLAKAKTEPYTIDASSDNIELQVIDNKRYTMRDIGKLERRIENIEYYTSLSMLEQETKSMAILDSNGLDRFKNGFLVDPFNGHGIGQTDSLDYKCSIDTQFNVLRAMADTNNIDLKEFDQRSPSNYQVTGDMLTLPYTNEILIEQLSASRIENVNPFAIFTFIGNIAMKPSSDNWFETKYAPDVIIRKEGNYNSLLALGKTTNAFGTVWNSWNTIWRGNPVHTSTHTVYYGGRPWRLDWVGTFQNTAVQSRTGIKTSLVEKIDTQVVGDKVISRSVIPYMRSRAVVYVARGLKPSTNFYPFFDGISVSNYITPASTIVFSSVVGFGSTFDCTTNASGDGENIARQYNNNIETALTTGDVITGLTSGATAVVTLYSNLASGSTLSIVNIKGTFQTNEIIVGSISGARGKITSITLSSLGSTLTSNVNGDVCGLFIIPNDEKLKFRTGDHEFKLTTSVSNGVNTESSARSGFSAMGTLNTNQRTVVATRNGEIVREVVNESQVITETTQRVLATGYYDPLAQSFLVRQYGGAFLTGVDVFFATKDAKIPVQMEIREMVNGYPGKKILPGSKVLLTPDKVNISPNIVTLPDGRQTYAADTPTRFTFPEPVYTMDNTEYAIVLISDSNGYNVWISQMGDKIIGTDRYISEQPYAGVMFKSQNGSTWTAEQTQDMKFIIHRAKFNTAVNGAVKFNNFVVPKYNLTTQSLQTLNGSTLVRVWHQNHGMINGDKVTLSGFVGTFNGITAANLNTSFIISNADLNTYTITVASAATSTGYTGYNGSQATQNYRYETLTPNVQYLNFADTAISFDVKTTSIGGVLDTSYTEVSPDTDKMFDSPKSILSDINETYKLAGSKSLEMIAHLTSTNDAVSPVIDLHRISMITSSNLIDSYSTSTGTLTQSSNYISTALDARVLASGAVFALDSSTSKITTSDSTTQDAFKTALIGKFVTLANCSNGANNKTYKIIDVDYTSGTYIKVDQTLITESAGAGKTVTINDFYIDEIAGVGGNSAAKYVTKKTTFLNTCTHFSLTYAYILPQYTQIDTYYKIIPTNGSIDESLIPYTLITPDSSFITDAEGINDISFKINTPVAFNTIVVKLVLKSSVSSYVPFIKDFRLIACA